MIKLVNPDNLALVLALGKGRSSSQHLRHICRCLFALSISSDAAFVARWIPSELNPADGPSRAPLPASVTASPGDSDPRRRAWASSKPLFDKALQLAVSEEDLEKCLYYCRLVLLS